MPELLECARLRPSVADLKSMILREDDLELPADIIQGGLELAMGNAKPLPKLPRGSEEMSTLDDFVIDRNDQP